MRQAYHGSASGGIGERTGLGTRAAPMHLA